MQFLSFYFLYKNTLRYSRYKNIKKSRFILSFAHKEQLAAG